MKKISILFLFALLMGCGATINYDYEKSTDFSQYKTYSYFSDMQSGLSELDEKRFIAALNEALKVKGFTMAESPDFFIDIQSEVYDTNNQSNVGVGLGGGGRNVGGGLSIGIPVGQSSMTRLILVEFIDKDRTGLFWQANSSSSYRQNASPEKREADFITLAAKILSKYPPK